MTDRAPRWLAVVGPTASGKTAVAVELAARLGAEAVSCDSMQVYRSMPVVTQAPGPEERRRLVTHLVDFLEPEYEYSAALFRIDAERLIAEILGRGRVPMVVGGTGLYLRALLDGLFETQGAPHRDAELRARLEAERRRQPAGWLHGELERVDAASAARIHPNDTRRLIRAIEVHRLTGQPLSVQRPLREGLRARTRPLVVWLDRDRADLYARIDRRVDGMMDSGLAEEVRGLLARPLSQTARMALGIREMSAWIEGRASREEAVEELKKNTRNYAKRQLSWFRHEPGAVRVPVDRDEPAAAVAGRILASWEGAAP